MLQPQNKITHTPAKRHVWLHPSLLTEYQGLEQIIQAALCLPLSAMGVLSARCTVDDANLPFRVRRVSILNECRGARHPKTHKTLDPFKSHQYAIHSDIPVLLNIGWLDRY